MFQLLKKAPRLFSKIVSVLVVVSLVACQQTSPPSNRVPQKKLPPPTSANPIEAEKQLAIHKKFNPDEKLDLSARQEEALLLDQLEIEREELAAERYSRLSNLPKDGVPARPADRPKPETLPEEANLTRTVPKEVREEDFDPDKEESEPEKGSEQTQGDDVSKHVLTEPPQPPPQQTRTVLQTASPPVQQKQADPVEQKPPTAAPAPPLQRVEVPQPPVSAPPPAAAPVPVVQADPPAFPPPPDDDQTLPDFGSPSPSVEVAKPNLDSSQSAPTNDLLGNLEMQKQAEEAAETESGDVFDRLAHTLKTTKNRFWEWLDGKADSPAAEPPPERPSEPAPPAVPIAPVKPPTDLKPDLPHEVSDEKPASPVVVVVPAPVPAPAPAPVAVPPPAPQPPPPATKQPAPAPVQATKADGELTTTPKRPEPPPSKPEPKKPEPPAQMAQRAPPKEPLPMPPPPKPAPLKQPEPPAKTAEKSASLAQIDAQVIAKPPPEGELCRKIRLSYEKVSTQVGAPKLNNSEGVPIGVKDFFYEHVVAELRNTHNEKLDLLTLRRNHFSCSLIPIIHRANAVVFLYRYNLLKIKAKMNNNHAVTKEEADFVLDLHKKYRVQAKIENREKLTLTNLDDVLEHVDIVPMAFLLATAIHEAGVGMDPKKSPIRISRFAWEGRSLFGRMALPSEKCIKSQVNPNFCVKFYNTVEEGIGDQIKYWNATSNIWGVRFRRAREVQRATPPGRLDTYALVDAIQDSKGNGYSDKDTLYESIVRGILTNMEKYIQRDRRENEVFADNSRAQEKKN